jgi:hypothetical protein
MAQTDRTIFDGRSDNPLEKLNGVGTFFTGMDASAYADIELDPYVSGYSFIYWVKLPTWFEKDGDLKYFRVLTQKTMRSFQGLTDVELQDAAQQSGFAGNEASVVTGIQRGNTDFTIGFKEFSGTPITKMFNKWITYIRDKNTGISLYSKVFDCEYSARNHTAILLYIAVRPDVTNVTHQNIEKAVLYANVFPVNIPLSTLFNYDLGSQESPTSVDINFKGVPFEGKAVDDYAAKILKNEILDVSEDNNNGLLFLDSLTKAGDENTNLITSGVLKDIYNPDDSTKTN